VRVEISDCRARQEAEHVDIVVLCCQLKDEKTFTANESEELRGVEQLIPLWEMKKAFLVWPSLASCILMKPSMDVVTTRCKFVSSSLMTWAEVMQSLCTFSIRISLNKDMSPKIECSFSASVLEALEDDCSYPFSSSTICLNLVSSFCSSLSCGIAVL